MTEDVSKELPLGVLVMSMMSPERVCASLPTVSNYMKSNISKQ